MLPNHEYNYVKDRPGKAKSVLSVTATDLKAYDLERNKGHQPLPCPTPRSSLYITLPA